MGAQELCQDIDWMWEQQRWARRVISGSEEIEGGWYDIHVSSGYDQELTCMMRTGHSTLGMRAVFGNTSRAEGHQLQFDFMTCIPEASGLTKTMPPRFLFFEAKETDGPDPILWPYRITSPGSLPAWYSHSKHALMSFLHRHYILENLKAQSVHVFTVA